MKNLYLLIAFLTSLFFMTGCGLFDDESGSSVDPLINVYMPSEEGNSWTYLVDELNNSYSYYMVYTIVNIETDGHDTWPLLVMEHHDENMNPSGSSYGMYLLESEGNCLNFVQMPEYSNESWMRTPYLVTNFVDKNIGDVLINEDVMQVGYTTFSSKLSLLAKDTTISVPAGEFENCVIIRNCCAMIASNRYWGIVKDIIYAPNTGIISTDFYEDISSEDEDLVLESRYELTSFVQNVSNNEPSKPIITEMSAFNWTWECNDPDGDDIYYIILYSDRSDNLSMQTLLSRNNSDYSFPNFEDMSTRNNLSFYNPPDYYFRLIAYDFKGGVSISDVVKMHSD